MRRSLTNYFLYAVFLAGVLIAVTKVMHMRYLDRITPNSIPPDPPVASGMDPVAASRIGSLHPPRRGSFQLATREKSRGTIRIGAFGDSFTYGHEVDEGLAWPSQLEEILRQSSGVAVEVINFGNPGFGAHQTHMMAEFVAPLFDLDYAVFAPLPKYWAGRDRSFTFWLPGTRGATRLGFHSRYVLDGDGLALVDVVGTSEPERFAAYTRFLPPLRYLRFDERPPAFLQAWLPEGRTLPNPFYYSRLSRDQEVAEIYRRLLREHLRTGLPTLVMETIDDLSEIIGSEPQLAPYLIHARVPSRFPYPAPQLHWSPWGQRLVAEHVAHAMGVGAELPIWIIETVRMPDPPRSARPDEPLDAYDKVHVNLGPIAIGGLYQHPRGDFTTTRVDRLPSTARFLVALAAPGQPLVDALFVPLASRPSSESITVETDGTSPPRNVPLVWVDPSIARADLCTEESFGKWAGDSIHVECPLALDWDLDIPRRPLVVRVGDQPVADIGRNPGSFNPGTLWIRGPYFRVHTDGNTVGQPADAPAQGAITLVLEKNGAPEQRVSLGGYRRVPRTAQRAPVPTLAAARDPVATRAQSVAE